MLYGMTIAEFWQSNPHVVGIYSDAYMLKQQHEDECMWAMGRYFQIATYVAVGKLFDSKGTFSVEYPARPYSQMQEESDDEIDRRMRAALAAEEAWVREAKRSGLPDRL